MWGKGTGGYRQNVILPHRKQRKRTQAAWPAAVDLASAFGSGVARILRQGMPV
jgi:hypothetical protein